MFCVSCPRQEGCAWSFLVTFAARTNPSALSLALPSFLLGRKTAVLVGVSQEFMENFRKAREEEEASRLIKAAKKQQADEDAEEVRSARHRSPLL